MMVSTLPHNHQFKLMFGINVSLMQSLWNCDFVEAAKCSFLAKPQWHTVILPNSPPIQTCTKCSQVYSGSSRILL